MPVHPVASGWHNDRVRLHAHRALSASRKAETGYVMALQRIIGAVHKGVLHIVHREHLGIPTSSHERQDDERERVGLSDELLRRMFRYVRPQAQMAFDFMAAETDRRSSEAQYVVGIRPRMVPGLAKVIQTARQENVDLITNASRDFLDDVRETLDDLEGATADEIAEALEERVGVSTSRAILIARDQTLKLNSALNSYRQQAAGVTQYRWSTSRDERVRKAHKELEGQVFDWDDPPETNDAGDTNHPGQDYQCRCIALPIIDELEAGEEETESEEPDEEELGRAAE